MNFAVSTAHRNLRYRLTRTVALASLIMVLSFTLFSGGYVLISLKQGLESYGTRLGADVIVVPSSSAGHGTVDDILLQGITGNYYISSKDIDKVLSTRGIEKATKQFYLTSAKASCCSLRVQIIGFDPETDFSIMPWVKKSYSDVIRDGDLVVGSRLNVPENRKISFYGKTYTVVAQLLETGTGLDNAVYTNMNTIRQMARDASNLLERAPFKGLDIDKAASAILIKVKDGHSVQDVADDINIHITKIKATSSRSMIHNIASGLRSISSITGVLILAVWFFALVILVIVFTMLSNERKREFALLRTIGVSRKILVSIMAYETAIIAIAGSLLGIIVALPVTFIIKVSIQDALSLPFLTPGLVTMLLLGVFAFVLSVLTCMITSSISAGRLSKNETSLLLREE
ncbi:MAG: FtsX-like permease family protein [Spirochaetales bacterium]|nr:FtsX-like permease family protein [Spirochaetales bacterium]